MPRFVADYQAVVRILHFDLKPNASYPKLSPPALKSSIKIEAELAPMEH